MRTGFIGLGGMGGPMALNLHKAGKLKAVWNRTREKAVKLTSETGVTLASDPATLARECELIITSLSCDAVLLAVVDAMLPSLAAGKVVVDTSTVSSETARQAAQRLAVVDAAFLDAPVSGGVEGARRGTLAMMVGGDADVLDRVRPILSSMASRIAHIGPVGSGQGAKAVNQVMVAGINQAVSESLAFGHAMGLPMEPVIDVLGGGAAGNWFLTHRGRSMLEQNFTPGFKVSLHRKDLSICKEMVQQFDAQLPIVEMTLIHYKRLIDAGFGDEDISVLFREKKAMFEKTDTRSKEQDTS